MRVRLAPYRPLAPSLRSLADDIVPLSSWGLGCNKPHVPNPRNPPPVAQVALSPPAEAPSPSPLWSGTGKGISLPASLGLASTSDQILYPATFLTPDRGQRSLSTSSQDGFRLDGNKEQVYALCTVLQAASERSPFWVSLLIFLDRRGRPR